MDARIAALLPLPHLSLLVLLALAEGAAHGWAIIRRIGDIEAHGKTPSSGSLYTAMLRLEQNGLLEEIAAPDATDDDARRRYYRLTPFGRRVLAAETTRLVNLVDRARRANVADRPARGRA